MLPGQALCQAMARKGWLTLMKASVMSDSAERLLPCQYLSIHFSSLCSSHSDVATPPEAYLQMSPAESLQGFPV